MDGGDRAVSTGALKGDEANLESADDRELAARFLSERSEAAFRSLYGRHTPFLYRLLLRLCGDASEAEEGVQETWVRAVTGLARFQWRSALRTWLAGVAIHWWQEQRRHPAGAAETDRPSEKTVDGVERIDLARALASLPEGYRAALVLHDVEGYTHDEIAGLTGVDEGTSKSQLSRARRALRARLSGAWNERPR